MGQHNKVRGAQRGVNAAAKRANASTQAANTEFLATGNPSSAAQRQATTDATNLAAQRRNRRNRNSGN